MSYSPARFEKHIAVSESGDTAVEILSAETPLSRQIIKKTMLKGAVWLTEGKRTQRIRRAKRTLKPGQTLHLYYDPAVLEQQPAAPVLVADRGQYSIWNKPYGLLSQGSKWGDHCTLTRWAEQHLVPERNAFVVHRLDRAANGLIIIAHQKQAAAMLSALFQSRAIDKRYRIWVEGEFPADASRAKPLRVEQPVDGRHAVSYFARLSYRSELARSLLDVRIETGRKHQIRRHVAGLGHPVVGDRLYGSTQQTEDLQLSAYYLAFTCPFRGDRQVFDLLPD